MFTQKADNPGMFNINLQLFAEGEPAGAPTGGEPAAAPVTSGEPAATSAPVGEPTTGEPRPASFEELWNKHAAAGEPNPYATSEPAAPAAPVAPEPSAPATPEWANNLPDKFKNADGGVNYEALANSYLNLEPELTRRSTELAQLRQQMQGQPQQQPNPQPAQQPAQAPQGQPEYTPEQLTQIGEQFLDNILDPSKSLQTLSGLINTAVNQALQQNIMPKIAPVLENYEQSQYVNEWNQQISSLAKTNPDIEQLVPVMAQVLDEPVIGPNGQPVTTQGPNGPVPVTTGDYLATMPNGIQMAYNLAKARQAQNLKSPEDMLKDNTFWTKAAEHPEIRKMVLTANAKEIYNNNQKVPTVIGSTPAGAPPATPPTKPTNAQEAGRGVLDWLRSKVGP